MKIASILNEGCKLLGEKMSKSPSKWAKLVGKGAKATQIAHDILKLTPLDIAGIVALLNDIVEDRPSDNLRDDVNDELVDKELDEIKQINRTLFQDALREKLKNCLNGCLSVITKAGKDIILQSIKESLNGKSTWEVLRDLCNKQRIDVGKVLDGMLPKPETSTEKKHKANQELRLTFKETFINLSTRQLSCSLDTKMDTLDFQYKDRYIESPIYVRM